jgi:hypothetical protein
VAKRNVTKAELAKGFTCDCGTFHRFPTYVYAHWTDELNFQCESCQRVWKIRRGYAWLFKDSRDKGKARKAKRIKNVGEDLG